MVRPEKRVAIAVLTLAVAAGFASTAVAKDNCRIYSGINQTGQSKQYDLPDAGDTFDVKSYGASSVRRPGSMLKSDAAVYKNGESIRITAQDSPVVLFTFMGDNFDDKFQAVTCPEGNICNWTYGSMRNKIRSFTCQRDYPLDENRPLDALYNHEIPTASIAEKIALKLDQRLEASSKIKSSAIKYSRMRWTNVEARCERTGVGCDEVAGWQARYRDALELNFKAEVDTINPFAKKYDVWVNFWFRPELKSGVFNVQEMWWQATVEGGYYSADLLDGLVDGIKPLFKDGDGVEDIGKTITDSIYNEIVAEKGVTKADWVFGKGGLQNRSVIITHTCDFDEQKLKYPGTTYTNAEKNDVCGSTTSEWALAPVLRILKGF